MVPSAWKRVVGIYRALIDAICRVVRLNAGFKDELERTTGRLSWLNACSVLITIAATGLAFEDGLRQDMHRVAPDAVDMLAQTVAIDISRRLHGTTGYVGRTEVLETLFQGGFTGRQNYLDKLGIQYPANVEMPDRINAAIQSALALKNLPEDATFANRRLFAPGANDPGFVDYVSWSFEIFGFRVESLYYFYFLILSASIALFLICFRNDALPLLILSGVMVAFLILLDSQLFSLPQLRTVHNQRFLVTLCVVPYLHLLFTFVIYRRPTLSRVLVTALQAVLFTFVMFTRSSALWMLLSFAVIAALNVMFRLGRQREEQKVTHAAKLVFSWPVILLALGLGGSSIYKSSVLHPMYSVGTFLPSHMVWHNAYMALGLHPDWKTLGDKYDGRPVPDPMSDNVGWTAAALEATQGYGMPESYLFDGDIGGLPSYKTTLHEKLIKERYLRFAFQHPRFMLELMLWYKPRMLLAEFGWAYSNYNWKVWNLLCLTAFLVVATMASRWLKIPTYVRRMLSSAFLVTGVMSLAPLFWTVPLAHIAGEQFLIWSAILLYFATLFLNKGWSIIRPVALPRA